MRNLLLIRFSLPLLCLLQTDVAPAQQRGVINNAESPHVKLKSIDQPTFLGGMTTLTGNVLLHANSQDAMYQTLEKPAWKNVETKFVPYFAWSNRG